MIAVLTRSSDRINRELHRLVAKPGIGAAVRREQLMQTQASIHNELARLWDNIGRTVLAHRERATAAAIESMYPEAWLRRAMPAADADYLMRSAKATAANTTELVQARLQISQIPLSQRVYRSQELALGQVDDIVNSALSRGASARELARDVRRFIRPDVRGGMRYAAMRLGRTELNNAFHAAQVQSAVETPWTTAVRWNLSGSHPRPDECNAYADDTHIPGGEAGLWRPEDVPPKPHPNCLCFCTPETPSRERFVANFLRGDYDPFVDEMMRTGAMTFR